MKKATLAFILILTLTLTACHVPEERHITCDEIIAAYEDVAYVDIYHQDHDSNRFEFCTITAEATRNGKHEYIQFYIFDTFEEADKYADEHSYNIAVWIVAVMYGESRWLEVGSFGNVAYLYYDTELFAPFNMLISGD